MNRIKCPNCSSTVKSKLIWADRTGYCTKKVNEYICDCGCHFEAIFELKEINILETKAP